MIPDLRFDGALITLRLSDVRRLDRERSSEWLLSPARLVLGGVGMDANGDLCGWLAYGRDAHDLATGCWPEQIAYRTFDDLFPAGVEAVVVYHGGDWRRAAGSVNSRLNDHCRTRAGGVAGDLVERAWLTLSQRHQADAFRQAQWRRRHQAAA